MRGADRCSTHLGKLRKHTVFKPETVDRLIAMLRAGSYMNVACAAAGISRQTYQVWMTRGKSGESADAPFAEFRERVEQAFAEAETVLTTRIAAASRENWQAAAWLLERRHPERWARVSQRDKDDREPAPVSAADDPFAEVDELAQRRRQR